jgi:hypothetical protein
MYVDRSTSHQVATGPARSPGADGYVNGAIPSIVADRTPLFGTRERKRPYCGSYFIIIARTQFEALVCSQRTQRILARLYVVSFDHNIQDEMIDRISQFYVLPYNDGDFSVAYYPLRWPPDESTVSGLQVLYSNCRFKLRLL